MKKCDYCGISYPEESFGVAATTPTKIYRRRKCRDCYRLTKQALIQQYLQWINEYKKNRGCSRCGATDPRVLDFHHKKDENKLFTVGGFRRAVGFDRIKAEVEKCEIICANCHRILHDEIRTNGKKSGAGRPKEQPFRLRKYTAMVEQALHDPISVSMLKTDGNRIIERFHVNPGPRIGYILNALLEEVLDNPDLNTEEHMDKKTEELLNMSEDELKKLGESGKERRETAEDEEISHIFEKYHVK